MKHLTVGFGEVGNAINAIVGGFIQDAQMGQEYSGECDIMHICFPYSDTFVESLRMYKDKYKPDLIIVHSTVPVGTCDALGVIHSPINGKHPDLLQGIMTFTKYFGGKNAKKGAEIFEECGIKTKVVAKARDTEAMKLISTTYYGLNIMIEKEIHAWCKRNKLDFNVVYTESNEDYNRSYTEMESPEFVRPNLKHTEGAIGGHCIIPNLYLLKDFELGELLKKKDETFR